MFTNFRRVFISFPSMQHVQKLRVNLLLLQCKQQLLDNRQLMLWNFSDLVSHHDHGSLVQVTHFLDLLSIVENLYSYNFEPKNLKYDAGQYQYYIDDDFQPKQSPGQASKRQLSQGSSYVRALKFINSRLESSKLFVSLPKRPQSWQIRIFGTK